MKKIFLTICLLFLLGLLVSCADITTKTSIITESNTTASTGNEDNINYINTVKEYLGKNLPEETNEDIVLPKIEDYLEVSATWTASFSQVEDGNWIYVDTLKNYELTLTATLIYNNETYVSSYKVLVKTIKDGEASDKIAYVIKYLEKNIPSETSKNIKLSFNNLEDLATISFKSSSSLVNHDLWVYDFPTKNYNLIITANIKSGNETKSYYLTIKVLSVDNIKDLPTLYVTTENNASINSKEDYTDATCTFKDNDETIFDSKSLGIRLRGNSTATFAKKPYRLKFDSKVSFFGLEKNKSWVLLANYTDQSLMRNYIAFSLGSKMKNLAFTPTGNFVELYLNGKYQGNYLLTEQVQVNDGRVEIEEESSDTDTGYLIELDNKVFEGNEGDENWDWFYIGSTPYVIKSPDTSEDYYNINQLNYIKNYLTSIQDRLYNRATTNTGYIDYENYLDVNSTIDYFIVEELMKNVDVGYSSVYMYKDKGTKLYMGPIWDFDLSAGNPGHLDESLRGPEGWYGCLSFKNYWFYLLMKDKYFYQAFKERYNEVYSSIIIPTIESIYNIYDITYYSAYKNFKTWDLLGVDTGEWFLCEETLEADTYDKQVFFLYDYLIERAKWLYNELNK